jgi:hypothetical protein
LEKRLKRQPVESLPSIATTAIAGTLGIRETLAFTTELLNPSATVFWFPSFHDGHKPVFSAVSIDIPLDQGFLDQCTDKAQAPTGRE